MKIIRSAKNHQVWTPSGKAERLPNVMLRWRPPKWTNRRLKRQMTNQIGPFILLAEIEDMRQQERNIVRQTTCPPTISGRFWGRSGQKVDRRVFILPTLGCSCNQFVWLRKWYYALFRNFDESIIWKKFRYIFLMNVWITIVAFVTNQYLHYYIGRRSFIIIF